jgi:hypothetical protein
MRPYFVVIFFIERPVGVHGRKYLKMGYSGTGFNGILYWWYIIIFIQLINCGVH